MYVTSLAQLPGRLRLLGGVAAFVDDSRHFIAEPGAYLGEIFRTVTVLGVFDGIVKQGGDRLVFGAAGLDHQAGDRQQVAEVRDIAPLRTWVPC